MCKKNIIQTWQRSVCPLNVAPPFVVCQYSKPALLGLIQKVEVKLFGADFGETFNPFQKFLSTQEVLS